MKYRIFIAIALSFCLSMPLRTAAEEKYRPITEDELKVVLSIMKVKNIPVGNRMRNTDSGTDLSFSSQSNHAKCFFIK